MIFNLLLLLQWSAHTYRDVTRTCVRSWIADQHAVMTAAKATAWITTTTTSTRIDLAGLVILIMIMVITIMRLLAQQ